jgi:hypothetical protein
MSFSQQVFKNTSTGELFDIFTTPTTNIIPGLDSTYDLGSANKKWDQLYVNNIVFPTGTIVYKETTVTASWTGPTTFSSNVSFTRVGRLVEFSFAPIPSINIPAIANIFATNVVPVDMRPSGLTSITSTYNSGANPYSLLIQISAGGAITLQQGVITGTIFSYGPFINGQTFSCDRIQGVYQI